MSTSVPAQSPGHSAPLGENEVSGRGRRSGDATLWVVPADLEPYLTPGVSIDSDHPAVIAFAAANATDGDDDTAHAIALYLAVRDGFRYDPYSFDLAPEAFRASGVLERGSAYCVPKAALLAAACRVVGIPARVGYADVRNHMTSARLLEQMGTDLFVYHGYTEVFLEGRWVKATPAFNRSLCDRLDIEPLEFDGRTDSTMHPLDRTGQRHMDYVRDHGAFADVPVERLARAYRETYPRMTADGSGQDTSDFEREAVRALD